MRGSVSAVGCMPLLCCGRLLLTEHEPLAVLVKDHPIKGWREHRYVIRCWVAEIIPVVTEYVPACDHGGILIPRNDDALFQVREAAEQPAPNLLEGVRRINRRVYPRA